MNIAGNETKRLIQTVVAFFTLLCVGTLGFKMFSEGESPWMDCLYMTVITLTTIGYEEVIDVSHHPFGRAFTMFIAISGIGMLTYMLSLLTAFVVEGHLKKNLVQKKIVRMIARMENHFIVCGYGRVGGTIIEDLDALGHEVVLIDPNEECVENFLNKGRTVLIGDGADDAILEKAGLMRAAGLFAVTGDDHENLVITLSARLLNPNLRIVARCEDNSNLKKMKRAGATMVASPAYIGGIRMTNEMVKPVLTSFVDQLFSGQGEAERVSSITVGPFESSLSVSDLELRNFPSTLLLAIQRHGEKELTYNPPRDTVLQEGDVLIFMTHKDEVQILNRRLNGSELSSI